LDPYQLFLSESDDYELIITCPPENTADVRAAVAEVSQTPVHEVGKITDKVEDIRLRYPDGSEYPVSPLGWDHFKG
jgi:thiamine monophosphate kinase